MVEFSIDSLYCGDNLEIMEEFPPACVDLCYIDPPFYSRRNHRDLSSSTSEVRGFNDTWSGDIENYIEFMKPRVKEIERVLKPNGSFYLHCDVSGVFNLKVMCDEIFSPDNFLNCIVWQRHSPSKNTNRNYGSIADYILVYTKGENYTFNVQYTPIDKRVFNKVEPGTGRRFRSQPLVVKGNQEGKIFDFGGRTYTIKPGKALKWTQETINTRLKKNPHLIYWTSGGEPRYKTYLDEHKGIKLSVLWTDIKLITSTSSERLDYPTQKPRKLIERIIKVSSNEGDVVLDAFNGSGTTTYCAQKLGRHYLGIDRSPTACRLAASRVKVPVTSIKGYPSSKGDLQSLQRFEYVNWVCWKMNATQQHDLDEMDIDALTKVGSIPIMVSRETAEELIAGERISSILEKLQDAGESRLIMVFLDIGPDCREKIMGMVEDAGISLKVYSISDLHANRHIDDGITIHTTLI